MSLSYLDKTIAQLPSDDFSIIKVEGKDIVRFFNGHTTIDIENLQLHEARLSSKTDRIGRLLFAFYFLKESDHFYLLCKKQDSSQLVDEFNKYIIMDDVVLTAIEIKINIIVGAEVNNFYQESKKRFKVNILSYPALIILGEETVSEQFLNEDYKKELIYKSGSAFFETAFPKGMIINSTLYMNEVDLNKGCFIGQETIKKIANNRGPAEFPCMVEIPKGSNIKKGTIKINDKDYINERTFSDIDNDFLILSLPREKRVELAPIIIEQEKKNEGIVRILPMLKKQTPKLIAQRVYVEAVKEFQNNNEDSAEELFRLGLRIDPTHSDLVESLGVLLGRNNKLQEAINLMDELLKLNPDSVMAHTNKSLYLMKLGKIEEAEEEKALATVSSFKNLGKEASVKKIMEEEKLRKKEDLERKESLFKQVLDIDSKDLIANFGMGEISYERKEYDLSELYLLTAIQTDGKYSLAYSILGKVYEATRQLAKAENIYNKGIKIASEKGEMMPANEMQSRLSSIKRIM